MWAMPFLKAPYCGGGRRVSCEGSAFKLQAFRSLSQGLNVTLIDFSFSGVKLRLFCLSRWIIISPVTAIYYFFYHAVFDILNKFKTKYVRTPKERYLVTKREAAWPSGTRNPVVPGSRLTRSIVSRFSRIGHVRYIKILTWLLGFPNNIAKFSRLQFLWIRRRNWA